MTTRRLKILVAATVLVALLALAEWTSVAFAEPELVEATPPDGQSLDEPPTDFRLCYSEPVQMESPDQFMFVVNLPDGRSPGTRTEFEPDGICVTIDIGAIENVPDGIWSLDWLVHAQGDGSEASGTISVQVGGDFGLTPAPVDSESGDGGGSDLWMIVAVIAGLVLGLVLSIGVVGVIRRRRA
jgi:methionine-rich copper-binding protein CopC